MIVYTHGDRLVPATVNTMTLQVGEDGFLYIDKTTYEQAVIINNKYRDDYDGLTGLIGTKNNLREIDFVHEQLPEPVNILAPFLTLIDEKAQLDGSLEQLVGCLHVISRNIDFTSFIKIPAEVRRGVSFNGHITMEYELQWQEFINECVPYNMIYEVFSAQGTFAGAHLPTAVPVTTTASTPASTKPKVDHGPVLMADENDAALASILENPDIVDDLLGEVDMSEFDYEEEMKKEESKKTSTPTPTPAPASTPAQSSTLPEAQSGKDMLDEWGL